MDETTQNTLLIAGVLVAGGLVYWHFSSKKDVAKAAPLPNTLGMLPAPLLASAQEGSLRTAQTEAASLGMTPRASAVQIAPYLGPKTATMNLKYTVKSSAPRALVRSGPTEDYPTFGAFQSGDLVVSTGFVVMDPVSRTAYVEVLTPDSKMGWVASVFLDVVVPTPEKNPEANAAEGLQFSQVPPKVFVPAAPPPPNTVMIAPNAKPYLRPPTMMYSSTLNSGGVPSGYKYPQET